MEQVLLIRLPGHLPCHTHTAELRVSWGHTGALSPLGMQRAGHCLAPRERPPGSLQVPCLCGTVRTALHIWNSVVGEFEYPSRDFQCNGCYPQNCQFGLTCTHFPSATLCHALESLSDWFFIARSCIFLLQNSSPVREKKTLET